MDLSGSDKSLPHLTPKLAGFRWIGCKPWYGSSEVKCVEGPVFFKEKRRLCPRRKIAIGNYLIQISDIAADPKSDRVLVPAIRYSAVIMEARRFRVSQVGTEGLRKTIQSRTEISTSGYDPLYVHLRMKL